MTDPFSLKFLIPGTIISIVIMSFTGRPLKQSHSAYKSILCLEFANDSTKVQSIIDAWRSETIHGKTILQYARINTYWDLMFIIFYSTTLFFAHRSMPKPGRKAWQKIFTLAGGGPMIAGLLDIIENTGMLRSMNLLITDQNAYRTATCATIKFLLLVLSIGVLLIRWIISKINARAQRN